MPPRRFDVAFCDPPYAFDRWPRLLELLPAGLAVLESDHELGLPGGWDVVRTRHYGGTLVTVARRLPRLPELADS